MLACGGRILCDDIIALPDTQPTQRPLTPDNFDVTGAIHKGQGSNSGARTRYIVLCVQFLTC
jgi:hypothetical protein